ncbi:MAG: class B sortase [Oscillospiraceae bacterium]|nr:class B sortase [Oscillospiraceae bacterium]
MSKKVRTVLIVFLGVVMLFSCAMIAKTVLRGKAEAQDFKNLAALTVMPPSTTSEAVLPSERAEETMTEQNPAHSQLETSPANNAGGEGESVPAEAVPVFTRNLSPLFERNSDCIGWLSIADTSVDYPVMHTPEDPEKYLHLNFDGEYSSSGVPFLQYNCSLDSDNLIIFGHNMKNGAMFRELLNYRLASYCTEHPTVEFETARGLKRYSIFAVVQVPEDTDWYEFVDAYNEQDFSGWLDYILPGAFYTVGELPQYGQQILTLSTCYGSGNTLRFLVLAVEAP